MNTLQEQAEACYETMLKEIIPQGDNKIEQIPLKSDLGKMFCAHIYIAGAGSSHRAMREVLQELVDLKDMKDKLPRFNESQWTEYETLKDEIKNREPLAWENARKLLSESPASIDSEREQEQGKRIKELEKQIGICKIGPFEHNKSIFNLGQCHSCYKTKTIE